MVACSLLALSAGYFVFAHASAQKADEVRQIGRIVGIVVILIALIGTICGVICKSGMAGCDIGKAGKGSHCSMKAR